MLVNNCICSSGVVYFISLGLDGLECYHPDHSFIQKMGVEIDEESGRPTFNAETMETNVANLFIAGVIAAGNNANEIFIENGRFHGRQIAEQIKKISSEIH